MELLKNIIAFLMDILGAPLTFLSTAWLKIIRGASLKRMHLTRKIFRIVGILPIKDHYYEPLFNPKHLRHALDKDRTLNGIDLNIEEQLEILNKFRYNDELAKIPQKKTKNLEFYYQNGSFGPTDAQYLYNTIRLSKPQKIIEIGSGFSTLMAIKAISANKSEDLDYNCEHICIEPYSFAWLEKLNIEIVRKRVEEVDIKIFKTLNKNDILFIDSSHMIRPQGDVLFEYLEILPILKSGVLVHIHDIFTPKDYLYEWILDHIRLWNEQYLLEAFLTLNKEFKIIAALNHLKHNYFPEISKTCPALITKPDAEPCSFWIIKK